MGRINTTEIKGVAFVEKLLLDSSIVSREQGKDCGIDLLVEEIENDNPSGNFVAVQVKSGDSHVHEKQDCFTYYVSLVHKEYWIRHNQPVILVYVNSECTDAWWQYVSLLNLKETETRWKLDIPKENNLRKFDCLEMRRLILSEVGSGRYGDNATLNIDHYVEHLQFLAEISQDCSQIIGRYNLRLGKELKALREVKNNNILLGIRIANIDTSLRIFSRGIHSSTQDVSYVTARAITAINSILPTLFGRNSDLSRKSLESDLLTFSDSLDSVGQVLKEMSKQIKGVEEIESLGLSSSCSETCNWSSAEFIIASRLIKSIMN